MTKPNYRQLINVLQNARSVRSISLTEKRVDMLVEGLTLADAGVLQALEDLLQYTGGWDLKKANPHHPIARAIVALEKVKGERC